MKVEVYTQQCSAAGWARTLEPFARVPVPGEYILLDRRAVWHQVLAVVHTPGNGDCDAQVYTQPVDSAEATRALRRMVPAPGVDRIAPAGR